MTMTFDIAAIRSLPIESVAERLGLKVERHRCLCPYHDESNPSLSFLVRKNTFRCFSCGAHGGVIDLAMKVLNKGFREACEWLSQGDLRLSSLNPPSSTLNLHPSTFNPSRYLRFFEHPFINSAAGHFLFDERKLNPRVVEWCRITSWKNWLQIPYFDINGNLIGVQWRNLTEDGPRFKFPYGSQCHIYNLPILKYLCSGEELYIAEGCSDCWSLLSSGHKAIAIPSATLLNVNELRQQLTSFNLQPSSLNLHIYPDSDAPGEQLYENLKAVLPTLTRHSLPSDCKDYSVYYTKYLCKL